MRIHAYSEIYVSIFELRRIRFQRTFAYSDAASERETSMERICYILDGCCTSRVDVAQRTVTEPCEKRQRRRSDNEKVNIAKLKVDE